MHLTQGNLGVLPLPGGGGNLSLRPFSERFLPWAGYSSLLTGS